MTGVTSKFLPPSDGTGSDGVVTGLAPREFYVFNKYTGHPAYGQFVVDMQFGAAVPGATRHVPWQVNMARLVDHGACRESVPFVKGDGTGLLEALRDAIRSQITAKIADGGADPEERAHALQASFIREGEVDTLLSDGFGVRFWFTGHTPFYASNLELLFGASFAFTLEDGYLAMRLVSDGARAAVHHPVSAVQANLVRDDILTSMQFLFPQTFRKIVLFGTADGSVPNRAINTGVNCEDQPADFCGKNATVRSNLAFFTALGGGKLADLEAAAKDMPAQNFFCRKNTPVDNDAGDASYDKCWYHPTFKRVNVTPLGIELVWSNAGESPEPPDLRFARAAQPNKAFDCTLAKPPLTPQGPLPVAGISGGGVDLGHLAAVLDGEDSP